MFGGPLFLKLQPLQNMKSNRHKAIEIAAQEAAKQKAKRRKMQPWNGKDEPPFEVEQPWDGKN